MNEIAKLALGGALLLGAAGSHGAVLYTLDFDGQGSYSTSGTDSGTWYNWSEQAIASFPTALGNANSTFQDGGVASGDMFFARDLNGGTSTGEKTNNTNQGGPITEHILSVSGFDTTGYQNLGLEVSLAANGTWESTDYLQIVVNGSVIDQYSGPNSGPSVKPSGSNSGVTLGLTFQKILYALADADVNTLEFRFVTNNYLEGIGIDNIILTGDPRDVTVSPVDETVPAPATLALLGLGLAGVGFQRRRSR